MTEMRSGLQPDAIRAGRAEVGFACGPIAAPDLAQEVLARERAVVALPARHPLARRAHVPVRALAGEPYVQVRPDIEPVWADACTAAIAAAGVMLAVSQQTDTKIAMLGLVAAGEGISVVSSSMMRLGRDGVVFRELRGVAVRLVLVSLAAPRPSPRADVLLRLARRVASSSA
jgi:DNA-binding transcriptional LysR family regulator